MEFGRKMLEFRAKHNLTQKQLAEILGVASNTVYRIECDLNSPSKVNAVKYEMKMNEWEEKNV